MQITDIDYEQFKENIEDVMSYFIASTHNSNERDAIYDSAVAYVQRLDRPDVNKMPINTGYFTASQCYTYISQHRPNGKFNYVVAGKVISLMEQHGIIVAFGDVMGELLNLNGKPYGLSEYGVKLCKWGIDFFKNLLSGFAYISMKYSDLVVKIEIKDGSGNTDIGTGFCLNTNLINNGSRKQFVVTNKHVVEQFSTLSILTKDDSKISYCQIFKDSKRDIAFLEISNFKFNSPDIVLKPSIDVLSEVITIGYPTVPRTKEAYQLFHKGEVNSIIEDYFGNPFFLVSNKSSSGNSGSPVINGEGCVVGILTQELFNKDDYFSKGKPPYYAAIPSGEIIKSFQELIDPSNTNQLLVF